MKKIQILGCVIAVSAMGIWWYIQQRITISVVIPVYNAEKYLSRCLDSIFIQSGKFEVIAVNDGSTDKSLQILEEYAKKYPNMRVINQKNQGISGARNTGMKAAKNKYITFIDNDDWFEPNAFTEVQKVIKKDKPDILLTSFYDVYDREWVRQTRGEIAALQVSEETKFPKRDMDKLVLYSPFYAQNAYKDLYYSGALVTHNFISMKFIMEQGLEFPTGRDNMEDLIFMYRAYAYNPKISVIKDPIYNYYNRVDSVSKSMSTLNVLEDRLNYMHQTSEYRAHSRQVQMWIDDSFLGSIFTGIANMQRHRIPFSEGVDKIYAVFRFMEKYNSEELKSCRYYIRLKEFLQKSGINQPL